MADRKKFKEEVLEIIRNNNLKVGVNGELEIRSLDLTIAYYFMQSLEGELPIKKIGLEDDFFDIVTFDGLITYLLARIKI